MFPVPFASFRLQSQENSVGIVEAIAFLLEQLVDQKLRNKHFKSE
ncbi:MAG: hypothetical protein AB4426_28080 [Xenococcaceae cyanobacterium]